MKKIFMMFYFILRKELKKLRCVLLCILLSLLFVRMGQAIPNEDMLMPNAVVLSRGALTNGTINLTSILNAPELSAQQVGDFAVWRKPLSVFNETLIGYNIMPYPSDVELIFALSGDGLFYFGAEGSVPNVLSVIGTLRGVWAPSCLTWAWCDTTTPDDGIYKPGDIGLVGLGWTELSNLQSKGYLSGLPTVTSDFLYTTSIAVKQKLSNTVWIIYYVVCISEGDGSWSHPEDLPINKLWCQFSSVYDNGTATRLANLTYQNSTSSYIYLATENNNGEQSWISMDGQEVLHQYDWGPSIKRLYNQYPNNIALGGIKTWSEIIPAITLTVVADSMAVSDWTEAPSLGQRRNPPTDILALEPNVWSAPCPANVDCGEASSTTSTTPQTSTSISSTTTSTSFENTSTTTTTIPPAMTNSKAIIVAGGGPYAGNNIWDATQMLANYAYAVLIYQGFAPDTIYYLTSDKLVDIYLDGINDWDADPTNENLEYAITEWAKNADDVIIYLVDHGGKGTFTMSEGEILNATSLNPWLDDLQGKIPGKVTFIYEACYSGSFVPLLKPPDEKERIVITSSMDNEQAIFMNDGMVTFSHYFWSNVFRGTTVFESFKLAKDAMETPGYQNAQLDDTGDGKYDKSDGTLSTNYKIGIGKSSADTIPLIGSICEDQTISGTENSATIRVENVTSAAPIIMVWGIIKGPDYSPEDTTVPVTDLPQMVLQKAENGQYRGRYDGFTKAGAYTISVYARDDKGNISLPVATKVTQTKGSVCPMILLSGGENNKTELLRAFRDKVLQSNPEGREYIQLFYKHAAEVTSILIKI
ncbi:MAG: hypothetical protein NTZ51_02340 [Proteobacteria bacterium]|nr:hypothetical protein [Pseudomonadota bacterium]